MSVETADLLDMNEPTIDVDTKLDSQSTSDYDSAPVSQEPGYLKATKASKARVITSDAEVSAKRVMMLRKADNNLDFKQKYSELDQLLSPKKERPTTAPTRTPMAQFNPEERKFTSPEPFELASASRHREYTNQWNEMLNEDLKSQQNARQFKARPIEWQQIAQQQRGPSRPSQPPQPTQGKAPRMRSDERILHRQLIQQQYQKKEQEKLKQQQQEEKQRQVESEEAVKEERKRREFRARKMPDFSDVWAPDRTLVPTTTETQEFDFYTDKRFGKWEQKSDDYKVPQMIVTPAGALDSFSLQLRAGPPKVGQQTRSKAAAVH